jgi:hypothetical protein
LLRGDVQRAELEQAVAKRVHFGKFLAGIDVQNEKWHAAEERLAGDPDHDVVIFAERPQQCDPPQTRERLAKDEDALRFEFVKPARGRRSVGCAARPAVAIKKSLSFWRCEGVGCSMTLSVRSRIFFGLPPHFPL